MHRRGRPTNKYEGAAYRDVVEDVRDFLLERARAAEAAGVAHERIAIDPGIGFGKSVAENLRADRRCRAAGRAGYPVLVGSSRKGFIGKLTGLKAAGRARSGVGLAGGRGGPAGRRHPAGARRRRRRARPSRSAAAMR